MATDDRWLDDLLSRPEPYIEDAGFTARVTAALPRRSPLVRQWPVLLGALAACFAVLFVPIVRQSVEAVGAMMSVLGQGLMELGAEPGTPGLHAAARSVAAVGLPGMLVIAVLMTLVLWGGVGLARARD